MGANLGKEPADTLEAIAQALFKSWFVGFDPVRAKAEGREPEGMPPKWRTCSPASSRNLIWVKSRKGGDGETSDFTELNPESWSNKSHPESLLYVDLANTKDNRIELVANYSFDEAPSRARRVLRDNDTIIGTVSPREPVLCLNIQEPPTLA